MKINLLFHKNSFIEVHFAIPKEGWVTCGTKLWRGRKLAVSVGEDVESVLNKSLHNLYIEEQIN
ncbi:hypothetical protein [Peribacillus kribbensis]|uniref:hypothetical protein n=1 Tax=Peribacillus kribbensis TaxID=356658 RepID=UPI00041FE6ED|nr:hypothetical protein [Peribacillus kribbensis]